MNGYEYTRQLKAKIAESPTHTLDLSDAIAFIRFYGLRNLLDKAISNNEIYWSVKFKEIIE